LFSCFSDVKEIFLTSREVINHSRKAVVDHIAKGSNVCTPGTNPDSDRT